MNNITLKPSLGDCPSTADRGDYIYGDAQARFLRTDWSLESIRSLIAKVNEPFYGLDLAYIRSRTWEALEALLPESTKEIAAMRTMSEYEDVFTGRFTTSLWPLLVLTARPEAYKSVLESLGRSIGYASLEPEELSDRLKELSDDGSFESRVRVSRIEQVCLGTGYTRACLPSDGSAVLDWQFAELSNGDILVLAGYEWFNK